MMVAVLTVTCIMIFQESIMPDIFEISYKHCPVSALYVLCTVFDTCQTSSRQLLSKTGQLCATCLISVAAMWYEVSIRGGYASATVLYVVRLTTPH